MLELSARLPTGSADAERLPRERLVLPFEQRQKSRLRTHLESGEEVALALPRGEVLRGGDLLAASDGRVVEVVARAERLLHVECATPLALARAAYHLGNRHVPVQVGDGWLRIAADHVLEHMLAGLAAHTAEIDAPFEPEAGAYAGHTHGGIAYHRHGDEETRAARIHEYGQLHGSHRHHDE